MDLCSYLGHLQNGCEAMADSLLIFMQHEQTHRAYSILKQTGILSPDGTKARAVKNIMKLIANSQSVAEVAPTEMAGEAGRLMASAPVKLQPGQLPLAADSILEYEPSLVQGYHAHVLPVILQL